MKVTTPRCIVCGETSEMEVAQHGMAKWNAGAYIQEAFPELSADDREMLLTGTHPACWDSLYPE